MTIEQLDEWQDWIYDYCNEKRIESDIFAAIPCNEDGPCDEKDATYICIEVCDAYGFTDFDILRESLDAVGIDYSTAEQFIYKGEHLFSRGWRTKCLVYGFNIPLKNVLHGTK